MGKVEKVILDTRFLLAIPYLTDGEKRKNAAFHEKVRKGQVIAVVPTVVLTELYYILRRKHGEDTARIRVKSAAVTYHLHELDEETALEAGTILGKTAIPLADSIIAATYRVTKANYVLTDDVEHFHATKARTKWVNDL